MTRSGGYIINGIKTTHHYVFGFDFTIKKITFQIISRDGPITPSNTYIHLETNSGKSQQAFGVGLSLQAISYSFDFAVGAAEELGFYFGKGRKYNTCKCDNTY